jgi:hypothetical protein
MKALYVHELYVIRETYHFDIELAHVESDAVIRVRLSDDRLIIDPTDGDLDEAEALRQLRGCCECPHESYMTVSVRDSRHACSDCGETFTDRHRTKRYFGHAPL